MSQTPRNDDDRYSNGPRIVDVEILDPETGGESAYGASGSRNRKYYTSSFIRLSPVDTGGCIAPCVTLALFLICLVQYGLLAAMVFFVFHILGSIIGSLRAAHNLALGLPTSIWGWRCANWVISFLFTIWLAGGLD